MLSNCLILCCPLLLLPSIFPSIGVFSNESVIRIRWPNFGASASASVLPMNIQGSFPLGLTGLISLQSKGLSRVFSNTIQHNLPWTLTPATPPSWSLWTWVSCSRGKSERAWILQLKHQNHLRLLQHIGSTQLEEGPQLCVCCSHSLVKTPGLEVCFPSPLRDQETTCQAHLLGVREPSETHARCCPMWGPGDRAAQHRQKLSCHCI